MRPMVLGFMVARVATLPIAAALSLAACADDVDDLDCGELAMRLGASIAATSRACTTADDCASVGYPVRDDGAPTCGCGIGYATSCGGAGVNEAAWNGNRTTAALLREWGTRCVPLGCRAGGAPQFDQGCGPAPVACVNQICTSAIQSCFDGGVGP